MKLKNLIISTAAAVVCATSASAHATSIGYANGGGYGEVDIWLGTYSTSPGFHGPSVLEGSMNLVGVNGNTFASTTIAFTLAAGDDNGAGTAWTDIPEYQAGMPAGLIAGVNNFYAACSTSSSTAALTGIDTGCETHWQGAAFSGLTAGDYQFTWVPAASPTAQWSVANQNMNGIFTIDDLVISGVPLPAGMPLLIAGLGAFGFLRNKKRKAA